MGVVVSQSFKNTIWTYVGFAIGAVNTLFLYTNFVSPEYYGLVTFILSTAFVMMPLMAFGVHNTIIKFYSSYKTKNSLHSFLTLMLLLPLAIIIPVALIGYLAYDQIGDLLSQRNAIVKDYIWHIFVVAIALAYFEIFYAWSKVKMQTVFGNFMKEVFHRAGVMVLLFCVYKLWISVEEFILGIIAVYVLRTLIMKLYAYGIQFPVIRFKQIPNLRSVLNYSFLIIIAGSIAVLLLDIDKFMLGEYIEIENVAYYGVAIYIASVIGVPARSMYQITNPITAEYLNTNRIEDLRSLYKKSSLNLFIVSGLIFLLIILNINELYKIIPQEFSGGLLVVFLIGLVKLYDNLLGNNNSILFNSDYYRMVLVLGVILAILTVLLNMLFIPKYGINGAAFATFLAVLLYNTTKLIFVSYKFKMQPFTDATAKTFVLILVLIAAFYFWEFSFHPLVNIALKSFIVSLLYLGCVHVFKLSDDISRMIKKYLRI